MPKGFSHISSLKHLIELKLEEAPAGFDGGQGVRFACPVTGQVRRRSRRLHGRCLGLLGAGSPARLLLGLAC